MEEELRSRAAPRKAKKDPTEAPVFLQKSFQMIDTVCYGQHKILELN